MRSTIRKSIRIINKHNRDVFSKNLRIIGFKTIREYEAYLTHVLSFKGKTVDFLTHLCKRN
jgi:hypothetical protein